MYPYSSACVVWVRDTLSGKYTHGFGYLVACTRPLPPPATIHRLIVCVDVGCAPIQGVRQVIKQVGRKVQ